MPSPAGHTWPIFGLAAPDSGLPAPGRARQNVAWSKRRLGFSAMITMQHTQPSGVPTHPCNVSRPKNLRAPRAAAAGPAARARLQNAFDRCLPQLKKFQTTVNTSAHELCNQDKFKSCYRLVSLQTANGSRPSRFAPGSSANTFILQA